MTPAGWIGAVLPGAPLVLTVGPGGERWTLDGKPCHGGDGFELLTEGESRECTACEGDGVTRGPFLLDAEPWPPPYLPPAERAAAQNAPPRPAPNRCPDCDGRGYTFAPLWLRVRFEYRNAGDGTGEAFLYVRAPGGGGEERHAIRVRRGDALRCRWPGARA